MNNDLNEFDVMVKQRGNIQSGGEIYIYDEGKEEEVLAFNIFPQGCVCSVGYLLAVSTNMASGISVT